MFRSAVLPFECSFLVPEASLEHGMKFYRVLLVSVKQKAARASILRTAPQFWVLLSQSLLWVL